MIDLHSHILPYIDDGAKNETESLDMLHQAVAEGISTIFATPHHQNGKYRNEKEDILSQTVRLNKIAQSNGLDIQIVGGQEVRLNGEIIQDFQAGKILPLGNSRYLLVELPSAHVPHYTERLFYELQLVGLIPIIAHPERNSQFLQHPEKIFQLIEKGALIQLTASSLIGHFGKKIKRFSWQLLKADAVHFVASDAHNLASRDFQMRDAFLLMEKKYGEDFVENLKDNAQKVLLNKSIYPPTPLKFGRHKFLGVF